MHGEHLPFSDIGARLSEKPAFSADQRVLIERVFSYSLRFLIHLSSRVLSYTGLLGDRYTHCPSRLASVLKPRGAILIQSRLHS